MYNNRKKMEILQRTVVGIMKIYYNIKHLDNII